MHCGSEVRLPTLMVASFRIHNSDTEIIQVSDLHSPQIAGVDRVHRQAPSDNNIMLFRMRCFASLPVQGPAWYLDTDMLCNRPLAYEGPIPSVAVCKREFGLKTPFNTQFRGMDLREYQGKTLGEVYPYLGCATLLNQSDFWSECLSDMEALPAKFHNWYGDQEAIRNTVERGRYSVEWLPESLYACLPEFEIPSMTAYINHYKGPRKALMLARASELGLDVQM